jgi:hypothetical protein
MKTFLSPRAWLITILFGFAVVLALFPFARAADTNKEARVTALVHDVRLLSSHAAPRPASLNANVREGTAVRTGGDSRAELTFTNATITRLGANTVFSFSEEARTVDLSSGAILVAVPKGGGTVKVNTAVASVAVTGGIYMHEYHAHAVSKSFVIEGTGIITIKGIRAEPCVLHARQMMVFPPNPVRCPEVLNFDLTKLINGRLFTFHKLPDWVSELISIELQNGANNPPPGGVVDPVNQDSIDQNTNAHPMSEPPTPRPTFKGSPPTNISRRPK